MKIKNQYIVSGTFNFDINKPEILFLYELEDGSYIIHSMITGRMKIIEKSLAIEKINQIKSIEDLT